VRSSSSSNPTGTRRAFWCSASPRPFGAIGQFFEDFSQVSDEEVRDLLEEAWTLS